MKITLIRHSKTTIAPDIPNPLWSLSDEGITLAQELADNQYIKDIDVLYSSLQTKALETTILLAKPNVIPIKTHADLTEISSFTKKFFGADYQEKVHAFYTDQVARLADGETYQEALNRFNKAIEDIISNEQNCNNIGIVTHGNILSFYSAQFCNKTPLELEKSIKMPDMAILDTNINKFIKLYG
jgi:broad specificity phosphatase PhoE